MIYVGIDPGTEKSAIITTDGYKPTWCQIIDNESMVGQLTNSVCVRGMQAKMIIERPVCRNYSGAEVSDTALWTGMFIRSWPDWWDVETINRQKIRMRTAGKKATDSKIRDYLIERFDPEHFESIKYMKGERYGEHKYYYDRGSEWFKNFREDIWQAYALIVVYLDEIGGKNDSR